MISIDHEHYIFDVLDSSDPDSYRGRDLDGAKCEQKQVQYHHTTYVLRIGWANRPTVFLDI